MKQFKRIATIAMALAMVATTATAFAGCDGETPASSEAESSQEESSQEDEPEFAEQGTVFNIHAWNDEFQGFFEKYYEVPEGITVNWILNPNDGGVYQEKLDQALLDQASAPVDEKIDMFLAEADYIIKYTDSDATLDISTIGYEQPDTMYQYTADAATDLSGVTKGVSFQSCPAAVIYRRSIAKDVLGTDDPEEVQGYLDTWEKFEDVAAQAKEKGYYMTASYAETFRTFSNNTETPWVVDGKLNIDPAFETYIEQAKVFLEKGYTLPAAVWSDEKNAQMFADGKTMTFFGPAWYYKFSMKNAMDPDNGSYGDWAIVQGPQPYFWGGSWLLAATGTDNEEMILDIFNAFTKDEEILSELVEEEGQFVNNTAVNKKYAEDPDYGYDFLGGQNDTAVFYDLTDNIKFENKTGYDQLLNEQLPGVFLDYFNGTISYDEALENFYQYVEEKIPAIEVER